MSPGWVKRLKAFTLDLSRQFPSSITLNIDVGFLQLLLIIRLKRSHKPKQEP